MKMNLFVINGKEEKNECGSYEFRGHRAIGNYDSEAELVEDIEDINNKQKSTEQIIAQKFLKYLSEQRLSIEKLKVLPIAEQQRLKKEFLNTID